MSKVGGSLRHDDTVLCHGRRGGEEGSGISLSGLIYMNCRGREKERDRLTARTGSDATRTKGGGPDIKRDNSIL